MTPEHIAWHVNARRVALGREPVTMARVQRIVRWLRGPQPIVRCQHFPKRRPQVIGLQCESRDPLLYHR